MCEQTVDSGVGKKNLSKYYYDTKDKICRRFQYKGEYGNSNNFPTLNDCNKKCSGKSFNERIHSTNPQL